MTDNNAALVNDIPLYDHLADMQTLAMQVETLLEVIKHLENKGACGGGRMVITTKARELASQLNGGLDSNSLPKLAA